MVTLDWSEIQELGGCLVFLIDYGGHVGFEVRKRYTNVGTDGKATSCRYVCAKEDRRAHDKRDHATKNP